ncbi:MAG: hypothetical protein AAF417_23350, partial [Pseudomonadota bacterium]
GIDEFSRLPKGTILRFSSGAELLVEEFNPPCAEMGAQLAEKYQTRGGAELTPTAFSKAAKLSRGLVGVVEVAGRITVGDWVEVVIYTTPPWLERTTV